MGLHYTTGSAADICKCAMVQVMQMLVREGSKTKLVHPMWSHVDCASYEVYSTYNRVILLN